MKKFKSEYHLAVQKEIEIPIEDILSFEILRKRLVVLLETGFLCQDSFQKAISFALLEILAKDSFSFSFFFFWFSVRPLNCSAEDSLGENLSWNSRPKTNRA